MNTRSPGTTTRSDSIERSSPEALDVQSLRREFPILAQSIQGRPLVYLDNGATTQKPQVVIDSLVEYYTTLNANIHRGVHSLSQRATEAYEGARTKVAGLLGASAAEIVFVRGTTEAINLVAWSFVRPLLAAGDEIVVTAMEHHSNIVPWQLLCEETGAVLRPVPFDDRGELDLDAYVRLLGPRTKFVSIVHVSNALGTVNPVEEMVALARARGVATLVDGAQAAAHQRVDVALIDCDFYAVSGHKMYGPTGIGALYGKQDRLAGMRPYQGGGEMIASVSFEKTTYNRVPHLFEAGTPNIAGAIGFGTAVDWIERVGIERIAAHEHDLLAYATDRVAGLPGIRLIGTAARKAGILSFTVEGAHPHDVGTILDREGVAVRAGHHCAQPVMDRFGIPATVRASFAAYNTRQEVDALVDALEKVREIFG